jgi:hypothetical protein
MAWEVRTAGGLGGWKVWRCGFLLACMKVTITEIPTTTSIDTLYCNPRILFKRLLIPLTDPFTVLKARNSLGPKNHQYR